jgi:DNA-binding LacI/PurR family transcriptional regulator
MEVEPICRNVPAWSRASTSGRALSRVATRSVTGASSTDAAQRARSTARSGASRDYDEHMGKPQPTIVDLARDLGISKTTVSDALSGRGRVSEETRRLVAEAAARIGYVGNRAARSLRSSSNGAIGLHIPPIVRNFAFYMDFAFGAAHAAAELDVDLTLFARDPAVSARRGFPVDGALVVDPLRDDPTMDRLLDAGVPVVTVGYDLGESAARVSGVIEAQHGDTTRIVLDALWESGVRRPAFLGSDALFFSSWAQDVSDAVNAWYSSRGIDPAVGLVPVTAEPDEIRDTVVDLVGREGVDALVCGPQGFAARALPVLESLGVHVGSDFPLASLVGDPVTESNNPDITCAEIDPWGLGISSARLLADILLAGGDGTVPYRSHPSHVRFARYLTAASRRTAPSGGPSLAE